MKYCEICEKEKATHVICDIEWNPIKLPFNKEKTGFVCDKCGNININLCELKTDEDYRFLPTIDYWVKKFKQLHEY